MPSKNNSLKALVLKEAKRIRMLQDKYIVRPSAEELLKLGIKPGSLKKNQRFPASDLKKIKSVTGLQFTSDVEAIYQVPDVCDLRLFVAIPKDQIYDVSLDSPRTALEQWDAPYDLAMYREWCEFYREGGMDSLRDRRIHPTYLRHRFWFPIGSDGGGSDLLFDADPTHWGDYGQMIFYRHDPDEVFYVARSIAEFLTKSRMLLEKHGKKLFN